jgi:hypothetical protein
MKWCGGTTGRDGLAAESSPNLLVLGPGLQRKCDSVSRLTENLNGNYDRPNLDRPHGSHWTTTQ